MSKCQQSTNHIITHTNNGDKLIRNLHPYYTNVLSQIKMTCGKIYVK